MDPDSLHLPWLTDTPPPSPSPRPRQTADTFDAAATFFDLLREWGEPEPEVVQKIKFAKWNAARILKAIREGKDPNESNPNLEQEKETGQDGTPAGLDPNDPEVQMITSPGAPPQPATMEDAPDEGEPLQPPAQEGYFPQVPGPSSQPTADALTSFPTAAPEAPPSSSSPQIPPQPSPQIPTKLPSQFSPPAPPPAEPSPTWHAPSVPSQPPPPPDLSPEKPTFVPPAPAPAPATAPPPAAPALGGPPPPPPAPAPQQPAANYRDINQAQKHAKFAISALNFEDVPTAVMELRKALAALGTQ